MQNKCIIDQIETMNGTSGRNNRPTDLSDDRGSGILGSGHIGIFGKDWSAIAPKSYYSPFYSRYYTPYYTMYSPTYPPTYPLYNPYPPRYVRRTPWYYFW